MNIFFSIIIPLYNKEEYIESTISSVLKQSYTNFEIIIVDDGSTDKSLQIVKNINDSRIILFTKKNGGVSSARNFGIAKSKGEYICFLDSDDIWTENYLKEINKIISKDKEADMICSAYGIFKENPQNILRIRRISTLKNKIASTIDFFKCCLKEKRCIAFTSATCIKKKIIVDNNLHFEEGKNLGEDIDFWTRTACLSKNIYYNNQILVLYRIESNNSLWHRKKNIKMCYPYWNWYDSEYMQRPKVKKFTTRMVYTLCQEGYKRKEYSDVIITITKSRGLYLIVSRLALLILSLIKKNVSKN